MRSTDWKLEKQTPENDSIYSLSLPKVGRVFKLIVSTSACFLIWCRTNAQELITQLFENCLQNHFRLQSVDIKSGVENSLSVYWNKVLQTMSHGV